MSLIDHAGGKEAQRQPWLVACGLGGPQALKMATAKDSRGLVPWAGVAAPVQSMEAEITPLVGRAFCFLPLPVLTGFPVHVNGYFELSSNRRDIWYGTDMTGAGKQRSDWNVAILQVCTGACSCCASALSHAAAGQPPLYFMPTANAAEAYKTIPNRLPPLCSAAHLSTACEICSPYAPGSCPMTTWLLAGSQADKCAAAGPSSPAVCKAGG